MFHCSKMIYVLDAVFFLNFAYNHSVKNKQITRVPVFDRRICAVHSTLLKLISNRYAIFTRSAQFRIIISNEILPQIHNGGKKKKKSRKLAHRKIGIYCWKSKNQARVNDNKQRYLCSNGIIWSIGTEFRSSCWILEIRPRLWANQMSLFIVQAFSTFHTLQLSRYHACWHLAWFLYYHIRCSMHSETFKRWFYGLSKMEKINETSSSIQIWSLRLGTILHIRVCYHL